MLSVEKVIWANKSDSFCIR